MTSSLPGADRARTQDQDGDMASEISGSSLTTSRRRRAETPVVLSSLARSKSPTSVRSNISVVEVIDRIGEEKDLIRLELEELDKQIKDLKIVRDTKHLQIKDLSEQQRHLSRFLPGHTGRDTLPVHLPDVDSISEISISTVPVSLPPPPPRETGGAQIQNSDRHSLPPFSFLPLLVLD